MLNFPLQLELPVAGLKGFSVFKDNQGRNRVCPLNMGVVKTFNVLPVRQTQGLENFFLGPFSLALAELQQAEFVIQL